MFGIAKNLKLFQSSSYGRKHVFTLDRHVSKVWIRGLKLTILGATSCIGQTLSLLLKQSNNFDEIAIHDNNKVVKGLALELNAIDVGSSVSYYAGQGGYKSALKDSNCVIFTGGHHFYGNAADMSPDELYENCKFVFESAKACSDHSPLACICVVTNPLNCTVPIVCEVLKKGCSPVGRKVVGINTYQARRASFLLADYLRLSSSSLNVPVVGGCSPKSCVPLISFAEPCMTVPFKSTILLSKQFQSQETNSKDNKNDITSLSIAACSYQFLDSLRRALQGEKNIMEHAFVNSDGVISHPYCGMPVLLGEYGVDCVPGIPKDLTSFELSLLETALALVEEETAIGLQMLKELAQPDQRDEQECQVT